MYDNLITQNNLLHLAVVRYNIIIIIIKISSVEVLISYLYRIILFMQSTPPIAQTWLLLCVRCVLNDRRTRECGFQRPIQNHNGNEIILRPNTLVYAYGGQDVILDYCYIYHTNVVVYIYVFVYSYDIIIILLLWVSLELAARSWTPSI